MIGSADARRRRRNQHRRSRRLGVPQRADEGGERVEGAQQVGTQAVAEVSLGHAVQGAEAYVADAVGKCRRCRAVSPRHFEDVPGAGNARAVGFDLQVALAIAGRQAAAVSTGEDQLPAGGVELSGDRLAEPSRRAGDQCRSFQIASSGPSGSYVRKRQYWTSYKPARIGQPSRRCHILSWTKMVPATNSIEETIY